MLNMIRQEQNSGSGLHGRFLKGTVVSVVDDDGVQRSRVRIPDVHKGIKDEDLPMASSMGAGGTAAGVGAVNPHPVGSNVWVLHQGNDLYHPMIMGGVNDKSNKLGSVVDKDHKKPDGFVKGEKYADNYGHVSAQGFPDGSLLAMDHKNGTFDYHHKSGTRIRMDGDGNMSVEVAGKSGKKVGSGLNLTIKGPVNITTEDKATITASELNVNCTGGMTWKINGVWKVDASSYEFNGGQSKFPPSSQSGPGNANVQKPNLSFTPRDTPSIPSPAGKHDH